MFCFEDRYAKVATKSLILAGTSLAMVMMAFPAAAQTSDASTVEEGDVIVVTGSRQIIQSSIAIKRNATQIVDGLSADEIGDIPALSIGEALETLTGAASHRENGGATEISIRGLGPYLSSTVFNGREATNGSGDRSVNFSQFPSELLNKIAIYKTQDASLIEGGVAGQIHLDTLKPLDHGKRRFQFNVKGNVNPDQLDQKDTIEGDIGYRLTGSYVDQVDLNGGGQIGFSVGGQLSEISQPEQEVRSSSPTGTSLRPCLADPSNVDVDPTDSNDFGRGFSNLSSSNGGSSLNADDCEDYSGGNDSTSGENQRGVSTLIGSADAGLPFALVPNERGYRQNDTSDSRDAIFGAIQFQPNDKWDINIDAQYSERVQKEDRHDIATTQARRNQPGVTFDSLNLSNTGAVSAFTNRTQLEARGETYNRTEEYLGLGGNVAFQATDRLKVAADLSFSETTRTEQQLLIRTQSDDGPLVAWERESGFVGSFTLEDFDVNDNSLFIDRYRARIDNDLDRTDEILAGRLDFGYDLGDTGLTSVSFGARYSERDYLSLSGARDEFEIRNDRNVNGTRVRDTNSDEEAAIVQAQIDAGNAEIASLNAACSTPFQESGFLSAHAEAPLFTNIDSDGNVISTSNSFATFDTECLVNGVVNFRGGSFGLPELDRNATNVVDFQEDTIAAYVKVDYATELNTVPVRGNFGLRVVNTEATATGNVRDFELVNDGGVFSLEETGDIVQTEADASYTELLPSFTFVADIRDDVIFRGGIFRGLSRADPADSGNARNFGIDNDDEGATSVQELLSGATAVGNVDNKPLTSWNYDASLEFYPNDDTIVSFGAYVKEFKGGFENIIQNETFNIAGEGVTLPVTVQSTSDETSRIAGFEFTGTHRFSYLPGLLSGLGAKVGYNFADSNFEFQDSNLGDIGKTDLNGNFQLTNIGIIAPAGLPGLSKHVFNAQLYYQIGDFDIQGRYKYRSRYFQPFTSNGTRIRYTNAAGVFEARASYKINDNFSVSAEAINLFNEERTDSFYVTDNVAQASVYGPRIFFGLKGKF